MGVRQELVRVSVRAVDMLSSFLSPRGVGRLRIGPVAQHYVLARLAERIEWLGSRLRLAVDRARRRCFAWASRRLASMCETRFGQLPLLHCVDREAPQPRIDPPSQLPQTSPATTAAVNQAKPDTPQRCLAALQPETLSRHRGQQPVLGRPRRDPAQATVTTGAPLRRRGQPPWRPRMMLWLTTEMCSRRR